MSVRLLLRLLLFSLPVSLISACEIINPEEDTPSYLKINNIAFDSQGKASASNNIIDAWVYANGKFIGTFELPATIPVLAKDSVKVEIKPGVYADGIKQARFPYPFYTQFNKTVWLEPGKVTEVSPQTKFSSQLTFPLDIKEEFTNSAQLAFRTVSNSPYKLETSNDPSLINFPYAEGAVGLVRGISGNMQTIMLESVFLGSFPLRDSRAVYLELDYLTTMNLQIGLGVTVSANAVEDLDLNLNPSLKWNKVYVNLTEEANNPNYRNGKFRILIKAIPTGKSSDYLALDNIRLIHF